MGQAKKAMMENEENNDLIDFLTTLEERDELSGAVAGITKQIKTKGVNSMSQNQEKTINGFVEKYKQANDCEMCLGGNIGSLTEYIYINDYGLCPSCQHSKEKFMKD
jgi:hypothetical protein